MIPNMKSKKKNKSNQSIYVLICMENEQQDSNDEVKETDRKPNNEFISSSLSETSNKIPMMNSKKMT
jgi:hypothetical protein